MQCMVCGGTDFAQYDEGLECQRCGAMNGEEGGSCSYDPNEVKERMEDYEREQSKDDWMYR